MKEPNDHSTRRALPTFLLLGLVFICYANTLKAPWYFDDLIRIVNNPAIHLTELSPAALRASLDPAAGQSHSRDAFFRPVAMLSFALNWYFTKGAVAGFHLVNILIHFLTAAMLYRTILALARAPRSSRFEAEQAPFIALMASVLWAVHPIQTQAVTYIIQRTTSLAGLFFIAGIYVYLHGRQAARRSIQGAAFALCAVCYLLAMGTKLNTAIMPLSILLIEILFFQDLDTPRKRIRILVGVAVAGVVTVVLGMGLLWFLKGDPLAPIFSGYQGRPFTLPQRLMTESRIVIFYLSQILLPAPDRLAFMRDITISQSLLNPGTTLGALVAVVALVATGVAAARRLKFLSLAILFFFLNHLVESTIIPLELMYEHRNYIPSMFVFVPLAAVMAMGIDRWRHTRRFLFYSLVAGTISLTVLFGTATHIRNSVWASERLFWEDVLVKAPGSARPYMQLAAYHEKQGRYGLALKLYARSLALYDPAPQRARAGAHNNMGTIFNRLNQTDAAISHFEKALTVNPRHEIARHNLLFPLIRANRLDDARMHAEILLQQNPHHPYYLNSAGFILLQKGLLSEARQQFEKALSITPMASDILINLGLTMGRLAHYPQAIALLEKAHQLTPSQPTALLSLIEILVRAGDNPAADRYAEKLIRRIPLALYYARVAGPRNGLTPYDTAKILPILSGRLKNIAGPETDTIAEGNAPSS